jgi:hypothetical protein
MNISDVAVGDVGKEHGESSANGSKFCTCLLHGHTLGMFYFQCLPFGKR